MKTYKTNINCAGCVARVTPLLNSLKGIEKWKVDTNNKDKLLEINGEISPEDLKTALAKLDFKAEELT